MPGHIVSDPATLPGVVLDDTSAEKTGTWIDSVYYKSYVGAGYIHDDNAAKGERSIVFRTDLPAGGMYEVRMSYTPGESRAPTSPSFCRLLMGNGSVSSINGKYPRSTDCSLHLGRFDSRTIKRPR